MDCGKISQDESGVNCATETEMRNCCFAVRPAICTFSYFPKLHLQRFYFKIRHVPFRRNSSPLSPSALSANACRPSPLEEPNLLFALYGIHCSNCSFNLFMSDIDLWEPSVNSAVSMWGTRSLVDIRLFCSRVGSRRVRGSLPIVPALIANRPR